MSRTGTIRIEAAAENNLREVDVAFGAGITAVVGVSGSGKSSLVFDTLYHESRRRFLETLVMGSPALRMRPARVRAVHGLRPSVAVAQNVVNRNPQSTLATAVGVHPFLRVLFARFARQACARCGEETTIAPLEAQLGELRGLVTAGPVDVVAPLVRGVPGSHRRLLTHLAEAFPAGTIAVGALPAEAITAGALPAGVITAGAAPAGAITVDGEPWRGGELDPRQPHDIAVLVGTAAPGASTPQLRELLAGVAALGTAQVRFRTHGAEPTELTLSRAALCVGCGAALPVARPQDFRTGEPSTGGYRLAGRTLDELLELDVRTAMTVLGDAELPRRAAPVVEHVRRRLAALAALDLGYLTLGRASPSLSRGEAQRVRLAVILANGIEDVLHVVDEPTIGLDAGQVGRLLGELSKLRGPVVLVEHDRFAVAQADQVVELGPGAGPDGGRVVFDGTPAGLWAADTPSGRWFSGRASLDRDRGAPVDRAPMLAVRRARLHNLTGFDCEFPIGALTAVTGPSGAGKTTLVRDVLVASLQAGEPTGCSSLDGPALKPIFVDQSPIGRNPRSNPATYTGLAERIRTLFASATDLPGSAFSFNRREGACEDCGGIGAVEVRLRYLASEWMTCESCQGQRFGDDVLAAGVEFPDGEVRTVADVYRLTVGDAAPLLGGDAKARRVLGSLLDVGLDYLQLGQPSPTLSGGEAQRVKLAKQLAAAKPGQLVFLDEPTTGLHPANLSRLLSVLRTLTERGCTVVVVEHNPDVVAAADWVIRLGPGGGPEGGRLLSTGPVSSGAGPTFGGAGPASRGAGLASSGAGPALGTAGAADRPVPRDRPRARRRGSAEIRVEDASANNLRSVSVSFPKDAVTAVVGVSGSGKSSLVRDVLAAEATRRLLECLSMYERQSVREGPQARVGSVTGLGPTVAIGAQRGLSNPRSTVGTATELSSHLGVLLSYAGDRDCPACGGRLRREGPAPDAVWRCAACGAGGDPVPPVDFLPSTYGAACLRCHGLGTVSEPRVERLIVDPDRPVCGGALYSPGFFPESYLAKPANGGYWMLQALGERYAFDPFATPWRRMSRAAREAFLFGEEDVELAPQARRLASRTVTWRGLFRIFASWDVGGLYTEHVECPDCRGGRLRPRLLGVRVAGRNRHALHHDPVADVRRSLAGVRMPDEAPSWAGQSLTVVCRRLEFLERVGLGYLHLDRLTSTLSAGEVQRVRLASLLGAELTGMTVLLDEPSRGLHPREVTALGDALADLRDGCNTVVFVDHDRLLLDRAEHFVVLGPGAGRDGGRLLGAGPRASLEAGARSLLDHDAPSTSGARRRPTGWMTVRKPTENNLSGDDVAIPLGVLAGICGVSGSGKSTLAIDIVARALAPVRLTTSVAYEVVQPGAHEGIDGAPGRTVHADQNRVGIRSPGAFLGTVGALRRAYGRCDEAQARGLTADDFVARCDSCKGRGSVREDMAFLAAVEHPCDACESTGYRAEIREVVVRGATLPELEVRTIDEVIERWADDSTVARSLRGAASLGLGYLTLGQRSRSLSGGELQRLKLARELSRPAARPTLYLLDEPTVGLHARDVSRLVTALEGLVDLGHSVLVVDHDPALLARCDQLVELGPGGGPDGGRVVAGGTPEQIAAGDTATAPFLREVLR